MDTLVALGAGASFAYSVYALFSMTEAQINGNYELVMSYVHEFYFESAAMILTLITLGKMLEARSKGRTTDALKGLMKLTPKTANIIKDGKEITVSEIDPVTGKRQIMVTMKVNGVTMTLKEGKDYEIVKTGSYKNINKGTGKLTIRGIHGFGGTKTVSFQIKAQDLDHVVWYDSLFSKTMSFFHKQ